MDARKRRILMAIVKDYIASAEPVGSRTIARRYLSEISAATIRNEMADLEEMGFLQQPYTSAGRIPSDKGYRYYVDTLLSSEDDTGDDYWEKVRGEAKQEIDTLRLQYATGVRAIEEVVVETGQFLSSLTNYISLISSPGAQQSAFYRIQLVEMGASQAVAVLVTDSGQVANRVIQIPQGADQYWLNQVSEYLSYNLQGLSLEQIAKDGLGEIQKQLAGRRRDHNLFFDLLLNLVREAVPTRLYLGSATQLFSLPEFQDIERMRSLLSFIEGDQRLQQLLYQREAGDQSLQVRIGSENSVQEVEKLSLVSAPYTQHGRLVGYLGILGPTRMDYARVMTLVQEVSALLSETLERLGGDD